MDIQNHLKEMKNFTQELLNFLDNDDNYDENYSKLIQLINNQQMLENHHKFRVILCIVSKVTNNHHRTALFNKKIEQLFSYLKVYIKKHMTNEEIAKIFLKNKRVLLFLIEEKILELNEDIKIRMANYMTYYSNYRKYFFPEIKDILSPREAKSAEKKIPENFEELRKHGENDDRLYQLIRKDMLDEFIIFQNTNNIDLSSNIESSEYETIPFIMGKSISLIECAAFFGSINIFKYLQVNNIELKTSLWLYAICGNNFEIIQILQDNKIQPPTLKKFDYSKDVRNQFSQADQEEEEEEEDKKVEISYDLCLQKAVECHHNQIVYFLKENFSENISLNFLKLVLKNYNFEFIEKDDICPDNFLLLCRYGHYIPVEALLSGNGIDINNLTIFNGLFFNDVIFIHFFE